MKKMSSTIGKALTSAYILYACRGEPKSGYRLMHDAREILLAKWGPGSFYPAMGELVRNRMLTRTRDKGRRVAYAYRITAEGRAYLKMITGYFKNKELGKFMTYLMDGE
ncbi:MAG: PadR family transcriptional regulator [Candidatus Micrarchaeia archaeon]